MLITPAGTQPVRDVLNNLPVWTAFSKRFHRPIEPLDAPFRTGECAFLFEAWARRKNNVGKAASLAEKNLLHHKEVQFRERIPNIIRV